MIELPWPPKALSPNSRMHWRPKHQAAKSYRRSAYFATKKAGVTVPAEGQLLLVLEFVPPNRRKRDDDNLIASMKAGRDGIAEALGIDDNRFVTQFRLTNEVAPGGLVRVRIEPMDEGRG